MYCSTVKMDESKASYGDTLKSLAYLLSRVSSGKPLGVDAQNIGPDAELIVGGKDVRVDHSIPASEYFSGKCFSGIGAFAAAESSSSSTVHRHTGIAAKQYVPLRPKNGTGGTGYKAPSFIRPPAPVSLEPREASTSSKTASSSASASPSVPQAKQVNATSTKSTYWYVNWRKPQQKKHKTWDGDAYLMHKGDKLTLVTEKGLM